MWQQNYFFDIFDILLAKISNLFWQKDAIEMFQSIDQ